MQLLNDLIIISQDHRFKTQVAQAAPSVTGKKILVFHDDGIQDINTVLSEFSDETNHHTVIFCSYRSFSSIAPTLEKHSLYHYVRLGTLNWTATLRKIIEHMIMSDACSIPDSSLIYSSEIRFKSDIDQIKEEIADLCAAHFISAPIIEKIKLCYIEAVNNALYHGFKETLTEPKYFPETFHGIYDDDTLKVFLSINDKEITLSVEDNGGTLTPDRILESWAKNTSPPDHAPVNTDIRGRGLYIIANCVSFMKFHTCEGCKSQLVLTFSQSCSEFKGFSIKK